MNRCVIFAVALIAGCASSSNREAPSPAPAKENQAPPPAAAADSTQPPGVKQVSEGPVWRDAAALKAHCDKELGAVEQQRAKLVAGAPDALAAYNDLLKVTDALGGFAGLMSNVHPDKTCRETAEACERALQALVADINLDRRLYEAVSKVDPAGLADDTRRFRDKVMRDFRRSGVDKDDATREKLKKLHAQMVETGQTFSRNIREDKRWIEVDPAELKGLPEDFVNAHKPNEKGKVVLTTDYPDYFPVQTYAEAESVRKRLTQEFLNRGHPKNDGVLKTLLELRHEYAGTLGYKTWADYQAEDKMVRSAANIEKFIEQVAKIARPRMGADLKALLTRKKKDDPKATAIGNWDRFYYVDKVRAEKFGVDAKSVRPYFEYQRVLAGMLALYGELFSLRFVPVADAPVWHAKVQAYDLFTGEAKIGRFYLDMHPRDGKYSHAAMFNMVTGLSEGRMPEASLVCNFPDPSASSGPALMEHSEVVTLFHEFGHLIHHLLARGSRWVNLAGINTEWDFVEAPSQLLEEWAWDPGVLARFAKHVETGEPIAAATVKKMREADEFGKGIHVMRQVFYTALSYQLHAKDPKKILASDGASNGAKKEAELVGFLKEIQKKYSPYPYLDGTHEYEGFGHLEGYSSMYYTYQWSLVLAKDIFTRFAQAGILDAKTASEYREKILVPGGSRDAADLVKDFLGRAHSLDAYKKWLEAD